MPQLIIAGLGIQDLNQMTLESIEALKAADQVLYLGTQFDRHSSLLSLYGVRSITNIFSLYEAGTIDDANYVRIYEHVVAVAQANQLTVLLVPGHPRIGVTLVQRLESSAPIALRILAGISSFDTLINDLGRDPLEYGSIVIDANRALLFNKLWDASLDCYLYHVCSVGTRKVHVHDAQKDNDWSHLKKHLLKIYSPESIACLVSSSMTNASEPTNRSAALSDLEQLLPFVHFGTTLFIQAQRPKQLNREFYLRLAGDL
jgi:uncharacterized protein YabN with tetrapyrrole methylase and pyrophosphatase domain